MAQPSPLSAVRDRALALRAGGDSAGARRLLAESIEAARPHLGEDHPDLLGTAHLLARLHREADDPTGARRVLEEAFAAGERRWGHTDALMLAIAFDLASVAEELGNRHEARRNYQRVVTSGPGVLGDDHPAVRAARAYLGLAGPSSSGAVRSTVTMPAVPAPRRPDDAAPTRAGAGRPPTPPQQPVPPSVPDPAPAPDARAAPPPSRPATEPSVPHPRMPPSAPAEGVPRPTRAAEETRPIPAQRWDEPTVAVRQIGNTDDLRPVDAAPGGADRATPTAAPVPPPAADDHVGDPPVSGPPGDTSPSTRVSALAASTPADTSKAGHPDHPSRPTPPPGIGAAAVDSSGEFFGSSSSAQVARPAPTEPDRPEGRRLLVVLVAVAVLVLALVLAGAAVLALNVVQGRTTPVPAAPSTAAAPPPAEGFDPPGDLRLRDDTTSVTLTWTDPSGGVVPFVVAGGRLGSQLGAMATVDPGATRWTVHGLNPRVDYCFTVLAVYSTESYATSGQVCTNREPGPSPS